MKPIPAPAESLARELTPLLDEQIALLTLRASQLDAMAKLLVDRNDTAMERLLEQMTQSQAMQADTDRRLAHAREAAAEALGYDVRTVRLSVLERHVGVGLAEALAFRREQLADLAEQVRRKHMRTALLLVECARINRMLLEGLFGRSGSCRTYDPTGTAAWDTDAGLVDAEL